MLTGTWTVYRHELVSLFLGPLAWALLCVALLLNGYFFTLFLESFGGDEFPAPLDEPLTNFEAKYVVENRSRHRGSWRRPGDQASRS